MGRAMIVCICNNINGRQVREAIAAGADSATAVYAHHGTAPQCGRCLKTIRAMIAQDEAPAAAPSRPALAGAAAS